MYALINNEAMGFSKLASKNIVTKLLTISPDALTKVSLS